MHRMIRNMVNRLKSPPRATGRSIPQTTPAGRSRTVAAWTSGLLAALLCVGFRGDPAAAQAVTQADYDLDGSGFVTPAGMPPVGSPGAFSPVMPVGFNSPACDGGCATGHGNLMPITAAMGGAGCASCGPASCGPGGCGAGGFGAGGFGPGGCGLGPGACGPGGCGAGGGLLGKRRHGGGSLCLFCRGSGCTACDQTPLGYAGACLAGLCDFLRPYDGAGLCNQRWYDVSVEALLLDRNIGGGIPGVVATRGISGTPALSLDDVGADDLEAGVRVSAALIFGAGGNLEGTYMGGNEWSGSATATSDAANLYSFISDYGVDPAGGFDDTDRSVAQGLMSESEFHSAEINYRRRTMFPYCRFQSSWLVGLRYLRYDDTLLYQALGGIDDAAAPARVGFFNSDSGAENNLFGPQAGFDFWWNVVPGVSLGVGSKVAWMQNDVDTYTRLQSNSVPATEVTESDQDTTVMGDLEVKMVYRLTHSLAFRGSYYLLAVEDTAFGGLNEETTRQILNTGTVTRPLVYDDLVLQGFTVGGEYMW